MNFKKIEEDAYDLVERTRKGLPMNNEDICQNCRKHKATLNWVGQGGFLDFTHGNYERWCECCALKAQLKHFRKMVKKINRLEEKLVNIKCR